MTNELPYRLVFTAIFGIMFTMVSIHRTSARKAGGTVSAKKEGSLLFAALRLGGLAIWGSFLAYIINPEWMVWSQFDLPDAARWVGAGFGLVAIPLGYLSMRAIGNNVTHTVDTRENHELVTHGPYRWVRNPLYTTGLFMFGGLGLLSSSWFILAGMVLAYVLIVIRLPKEEAGLIAAFGDDYRDYMTRTGRFFPKFG